MATNPAEAESRSGLVLLPRDRLDGAARGLRHLSAAPERKPDRRRHERAELEAKPADLRGRRPVDEQHRHEDRKAAPDLDVEADKGLQRPEANGDQGSE